MCAFLKKKSKRAKFALFINDISIQELTPILKKTYIASKEVLAVLENGHRGQSSNPEWNCFDFI